MKRKEMMGNKDPRWPPTNTEVQTVSFVKRDNFWVKTCIYCLRLPLIGRKTEEILASHSDVPVYILLLVNYLIGGNVGNYA